MSITTVEKVTNVKTTFGKIVSSSRVSSENKPKIMKIGAIADYDLCRQGDIYLHKLPSVPKTAILIEKPSSQIAVGTTQGSRHCIKNLSIVKLYKLSNPNTLQGSIIDAPIGFTIEHPEHAHHEYVPGIYMVTFQRSYVKERSEELRRVAD